jgi:hypothetical protein
VARGKPVAFDNTTALGVPNAGVVKVGEVDSTTFPVPVEDVTPVPPLPTGNVPDTPVARGKPVAFDNTTALGVPKAGVVKVGEVDSTTFPVPVEDVTPVPPLATGKVPVTPVESGNPVKFVATPEVGVPKFGETKVGEVDSTTLPEPVDVVTPVPPLATATVPEMLVAFTLDATVGIFNVVPVKVAAPVPVVVNVNGA